MTGNRRLALIGVVLVLVGSASLVAVATAMQSVPEDSDTMAIDDHHGLDESTAVAEYHGTGSATADLRKVNGELTVSKSKDQVGIGNNIVPTDTRNNFVRIQYREDFERTLRIHIPRDYQTPYTQSGVNSITSGHVAEFRPVRGAQYLEIVVHVDEPADIVLPLQIDSSLSYKGLEWADNRVEVATGMSVFGSGDDWEYVDSETLVAEPAYELPGDPSNIAVQYDAEHHDPEETWLNAPEDEGTDVGVYWTARDSGDGESAYVISTRDEDVPNVRYKTEATTSDHWLAEARDAAQIPSRITDFIGGWTGGE